MSETPFYKTRMGQRFYEGTVPALVEAVERLADSIASRDVRDLVDHAAELADAAEHVLETEIVPGSRKTVEAFGQLRASAAAVRATLAKIGG